MIFLIMVKHSYDTYLKKYSMLTNVTIIKLFLNIYELFIQHLSAHTRKQGTPQEIKDLVK